MQLQYLEQALDSDIVVEVNHESHHNCCCYLNTALKVSDLLLQDCTITMCYL